VRTRIPERETHGLAGVGERLVASTESREHRGARAVATCERLIQGERAITGAQSFLFSPERVQCLREIQQDGRPVGLQLQRSGEKVGSFRVTSELSQRDAEELQEVGIVRGASEECLVARDRLAQAAGTMVANRGGEARTVGAVSCAHEFLRVQPRAKNTPAQISSALAPGPSERR